MAAANTNIVVELPQNSKEFLLVCINYNFYKETEVINDDFQNILPLEQ
jgi:hypothetical protein